MGKSQQYRNIESMLSKERRRQRLGPISVGLFFIAVMVLMYGVSAASWRVCAVAAGGILLAALLAHFGHSRKSTLS
jgi:hypothetical protein